MRKPDWKLTIASVLVLAWPALGADLTKFKEWDRSPEFVYLATDTDKKEWKAVKTDEEAEKFVALFWARRDPDIKTPANEFKARFDALVAKADEAFKVGKLRGAMTERGRAFILIGPPKTIGRMDIPGGGSAGRPGGSAAGTPITDQLQIDSTAPGAMVQGIVFSYEADQLPKWTELKLLKLQFRVEPSNSTDSVQESGQLKKLAAKAAQIALANPNLKELPVYKTKEQVDAEMKAAFEAAAEKERGPELSAAARQTLEGILSKEPAGTVSPFGLAYQNGATRLMIQVHAGADAVKNPAEAKLIVLVKAKDGKDAARREEAANLSPAKTEYFCERLIPVVPGDYDVATALLDAAGAVLSSGHRAVSVQALPADLGLSPILIAYTDVEMAGLKPEDPFVFAQRKFLSRGDGKLDSKKDGLSYVVRLYNPGIDPVTRKTSIKRTIRVKPKSGGSGVDVPLPPEEPSVIPESKEGASAYVVDLAGNIVDEKLGEYFRPGDYELKIKVTDELSKKVVEASAPFTVVGPPPAEKAPAPKKK
jgi:GWxTD domain-containing protein